MFYQQLWKMLRKIWTNSKWHSPYTRHWKGWSHRKNFVQKWAECEVRKMCVHFKNNTDELKIFVKCRNFYTSKTTKLIWNRQNTKSFLNATNYGTEIHYPKLSLLKKLSKNHSRNWNISEYGMKLWLSTLFRAAGIRFENCWLQFDGKSASEKKLWEITKYPFRRSQKHLRFL